jgi:hypothetical protein
MRSSIQRCLPSNTWSVDTSKPSFSARGQPSIQSSRPPLRAEFGERTQQARAEFEETGAGDYQDASAAITHGLEKGRIKQPDEAYVYLGRDWVAQNKPKEAKNTFKQLKTLPNISPPVLTLWNLYADTLPETVSQPL